MKKLLTKEVKKTVKAIHYFSGENISQQITVINTTCSLVVEIKSCSC